LGHRTQGPHYLPVASSELAHHCGAPPANPDSPNPRKRVPSLASASQPYPSRNIIARQPPQIRALLRLGLETDRRGHMRLVAALGIVGPSLAPRQP
jgi:hypothetical protein